MKPGEWAVSIDSDRRNQKIWMCFAPGVVKRMGTYEDFEDQIQDATDAIKQQYLMAFNEILTQIEADKNTAAEEYSYVVNFKNALDKTYMPNIKSLLMRRQVVRKRRRHRRAMQAHIRIVQLPVPRQQLPVRKQQQHLKVMQIHIRIVHLLVPVQQKAQKQRQKHTRIMHKHI